MFNPWLSIMFQATRFGWQTQIAVADHLMRMTGTGAAGSSEWEPAMVTATGVMRAGDWQQQRPHRDKTGAGTALPTRILAVDIDPDDGGPEPVGPIDDGTGASVQQRLVPDRNMPRFVDDEARSVDTNNIEFPTVAAQAHTSAEAQAVAPTRGDRTCEVAQKAFKVHKKRHRGNKRRR
jgi:hypothetical protein